MGAGRLGAARCRLAPMKPMAPVDLDYLDRAPMRVQLSATVAAPPATVFAAFADPADWTRWWPMMHRAAWTKGQGGVGSERQVALRLFGKFEERFIAWEPGARFAFTMIGSTSPMATQMAEDYRLTAVDGGTRIDWTMAATPTGLGRAMRPALTRVLGRMGRQAFRRLGRHLGG